MEFHVPTPMEITEKQERELVWAFDIALVLKAINGALEVVAALLIFFVPKTLVVWFAEVVTNGELSEDPTDPIATLIMNGAQYFAVHPRYMVGAYLVSHGLIKVLLVIGIFAKKKIAYPLFMIALAIFGTYEAYRGFLRGELILQALAVFDLALLLLTSYEYRRRYSARP